MRSANHTDGPTAPAEGGARSVMVCEKPFYRGSRKGEVRTGSEAGYMAHRRAGESACNSCLLAHNEYQQTKYRNNLERERKRSRERTQERYRTNRDLALEQLGNICAACGHPANDELGPLEFDHIDPSNKKFTISRLLHYPLDNPKLQRELDKCQLLHVECHKAKTAEERGQSATAKQDQLEALINQYGSEEV